MDGASLTLPKDLIEGAIKQHVALAVSSALDGNRTLVTGLINAILTQKVDDAGKPGTYSSNKPFLEWAVASAIRAAVQQAVTEEVGKRNAEIREHIAAQLKNSRSPLFRNFVDAMADGITKAAANKYQLTVKVEH